VIDRERQIDNTQRLLDLQRAIREGRFKFTSAQESLVREVMALSLKPGQLLAEGQLSHEALGLVRVGAMAIRYTTQREEPTESTLGPGEAQVELFNLFGELFAALTGRSYVSLSNDVEIRDATRAHLRANSDLHSFNETIDRLAEFYKKHAVAIFGHAKQIGGLKLVLGGQRAFGSSALGGVRKMALYADTQLIPDPIYPFLEGNLHLKAKYVELLINLHRVLQLKPLVDARLSVPPILVFPSFEKALENSDVLTQTGIHDLLLQVLRPACNVAFESMEDLVAYTLREPDAFMRSVMEARLFVPPGAMPGEIVDPRKALERRIAEIQVYRSSEVMGRMVKLSPAAQIATAIMERLAPQYHLLENGNELNAQPLLTQEVHWHYFECCATAAAIELNRKEILSADALRTLRALQDRKLAWLANVPITALVELLQNQENLAFRKELSEYTKVLFTAGVQEIDRVVIEISHGIDAMVQKHQKTILDIEKKYAPKYQATWFIGGSSVALGTAAMFLPTLGLLGPVAPLVAGAALVGKLSNDKVQEIAEKRQTRHSLLGVLATTPHD
jgi:hypothetical protein